MKDKFVQLRSRFMLFVMSIGLVVGGQAWAQTAFIDYEKAILVSKFVKYIDWPQESEQATFVIGVYDDAEKHLYFSDFFANKGVRGKDISVQLITTLKEAKSVNILYVPSPNKRKTQKLTEKVINELNVLVITEGSKELAKSMVDLSYNEQTSKIAFSVIEDNIAKGNIVFPELSKFTDKNDDVLPVSPTFARKNKQASQLLALQNEVAKQKSSLDKLNDELIESVENEKKHLLALTQKSERLKALQKKDDKQNKALQEKDQKLKHLEEQLQARNAQFNMSKGDFSLELEEKVKAQAQELSELTDKLNKQNQKAHKTAAALTKVTDEKNLLSIFRILFFVLIIIALVALLVAFNLWKKAKNAGSQSSLHSAEDESLLSVREAQLVRSENLAAIGYIATDVTYAMGESLENLKEQLASAGDMQHANALQPIVTLLDNFNLISADFDGTESQHFDLIDYIQKMLMLYDIEFSQSNITYHYSGEKELMIESVPSYIALVVLHIVNNALKHGFDNKGNGNLTLSVAKGAKSGATITVHDDGKGMSKAVLEQAFTPFYTTADDRGYVGAGMSTSYDLIKNKLSGDISIDSKVGKGTTVTITLP